MQLFNIIIGYPLRILNTNRRLSELLRWKQTWRWKKMIAIPVRIRLWTLNMQISIDESSAFFISSMKGLKMNCNLKRCPDLQYKIHRRSGKEQKPATPTSHAFFGKTASAPKMASIATFSSSCTWWQELDSMIWRNSGTLRLQKIRHLKDKAECKFGAHLIHGKSLTFDEASEKTWEKNWVLTSELGRNSK